MIKKKAQNWLIAMSLILVSILSLPIFTGFSSAVDIGSSDGIGVIIDRPTAVTGGNTTNNYFNNSYYNVTGGNISGLGSINKIPYFTSSNVINWIDNIRYDTDYLNYLFLSGSPNSNFYFQGEDGALNTDGVGINLVGGDGGATLGDGGSIDLQGGTGNSNGQGGGITLAGGATPSATPGENAGSISLVGGVSTNTLGGDVFLRGGVGGAGNGKVYSQSPTIIQDTLIAPNICYSNGTNCNTTSTYNSTYAGILGNSSYLNNYTNIAFLNNTQTFTQPQTIDSSVGSFLAPLTVTNRLTSGDGKNIALFQGYGNIIAIGLFNYNTSISSAYPTSYVDFYNAGGQRSASFYAKHYGVTGANSGADFTIGNTKNGTITMTDRLTLSGLKMDNIDLISLGSSMNNSLTFWSGTKTLNGKYNSGRITSRFLQSPADVYSSGTELDFELPYSNGLVWETWMNIVRNNITLIGDVTALRNMTILGTTTNITQNLYIGGNLSVKRPYWVGYDNSTQPLINVANAQVINISNNNDIDKYGINVKGNQNLTFDMTGDYICTLSPEFYEPNGQSGIITFWIQKNGVDVKWSNSRYTLASNIYNAPLITYQFDITNPSTDNIRFMWWSDNANTILYSSGDLTSPTRPSIPAVLLNCFKVSEITT